MESATRSSTEAVVEEGTTPSTLEPHTESSLDLEDDVSEDDVQKFKAALREDDIEDAYVTYIVADDEARRQCAAHLFSFGYDTLVQMIDGTYDHMKSLILGIVLAHADQDLFDKILDEMKPDDYLLRRNAINNVGLACNTDGFMDVLKSIADRNGQEWVAEKDLFNMSCDAVKPDDSLLRESILFNVDLACNTDRFMTVIRRIADREDQGWAIEFGVDALFDKDKTEFLDPMISALQSEASPDPNLANEAIQHAFRRASIYTDHRSSVAKRFHDHPAISAEDHSYALYYAYEKGKPDRKLFKWLKRRAYRRMCQLFLIT